ncbi:hypothetical protein H6P81_007242 [Aristolochia fimbriata]|uniref:Uncharacterized protein n=1 Tax=Aristolochia fimbriata TaxID=158543 RepID=A0AAV7F449_ARIFI|nr:hypothetical protein H6P81_007242 [Aristolochia fimbriata]
MEALYTPFLSTPKFSIAVSPFTPSPATAYRFSSVLTSSHRSRYKLLSRYTSRCSRGVASCTSAHFGRGSRRQNLLRKKLVEEAQVRIRKDFLHPKLDLNNQNSLPSQNAKFQLDKNGGNLERNSELGAEARGSEVGTVGKSDSAGESLLWRKLEDWVGQYKQEAEYWGVGSTPIFTVYQDTSGNIERVVVEEDEIIKRSQTESWSLKHRQVGEHDLGGVNSKISRAKMVAREIEMRNYKIPENSSIVKFVTQTKKSFSIGWPRSVNLKGDSVSRIGIAFLCGWLIFWVFKKFLIVRNEKIQLTREEKEMLRRKMKLRMEREKESSNVEILWDNHDTSVGAARRPKLDKHELMESILQAKLSTDHFPLPDQSSNVSENSTNYSQKILEIQEMARKVREHELLDSAQLENDEPGMDSSAIQYSVESEEHNNNNSLSTTALDCEKNQSNRLNVNDLGDDSSNMTSRNLGVESDPDKEKYINNPIDSGNALFNVYGDRDSRKPPTDNLSASHESSVSTKPKIIKSVREAREYLSKRQECHVENENPVHVIANSTDSNGEPNDLTSWAFRHLNQTTRPTSKHTMHMEEVSLCLPSSEQHETSPDDESVCTNDFDKNSDASDLSKHVECSSEDSSATSSFQSDKTQKISQSWVEENFEEFGPVIKKIGEGFKENYLAAKESVKEDLSLTSDFNLLIKDLDELEWMKDESLRDVVFRVRENELSGRDPFHMMEAEDKHAFFKGLEKEAEKKNSKLANLHKWIHSRVENLDYGADGISLDDPPEKFIPRWKGPSVDGDPEFLKSFQGQQKLSSQMVGGSHELDQGVVNGHKVSSEQPSSYGSKKVRHVTPPKTVIESSSGSTRAGKKKGKEHWEHTKKWTQGFLEVYNAETDPEVKSTMKEFGKDLDRWITDKELQEAAELMTRIPKRRRKYIEKKLAKLKNEMEMFGPQAVVSKYREYSEEKEEDYLWWLDLSFVLCIELYRVEDGDQKVGFYALEMAEDLELDPKPRHVIAFEDPSDSKNFCYILQAHLEMLGNGSAFIVGQPPKDVFRQAKANGFNVTVIRKGEIELNVDKKLEEVEDDIMEIGSKMYHDEIMRERSVDMGALMKGVFGVRKTIQR